MKFILHPAALLTLAAAFAGTASAQTRVYITGSPTCRAGVHQAICEILDAGFNFACDNANPYQQGTAIYAGKLNLGNPVTDPTVIIKTYWTGSLSGVYDVANGNTIPGHFPVDGLASATSTGFGAQGQTTFSGTTVLASGFATENQKPTVCLTDAFESSCAAAIGTAALGGAAAQTAINRASFTSAGTAAKAGGAQIVGLVAFQWVLGITSATQPPVTNITQQQALALVNGGAVPVMFLTDNTADQNRYFLYVGGNEDSGSSIVGSAEAQDGLGNSIVRFALTFSSNNTTQADGRQTGGSGSTVTSFDVWPSNARMNTWDNINWQTAGHAGYLGSTNARNVLISTNPSLLASTQGHTSGGALTDTGGNVPPPATNVYFLSCLSTADAAVGGNAIQLDYTGEPFSVANVEIGAYPLWSYEHMYYLSALSGVARQTCDAIADQIFTTDADINNNNGAGSLSVHGSPSSTVVQAGILANSSVLVNRSSEGGVITQNY